MPRMTKRGWALFLALGLIWGMPYLLIRIGILHLPPLHAGPGVATFGTYGFLAGFSEPFFFGVVRRIAGASESSSDDDATEKDRG